MNKLKLILAMPLVIAMAACAGSGETDKVDTAQPKTCSKAKAAPAKKAANSANVKRSQFTSNVKDREPIDTLTIVDITEEGDIYYFTEIVEMDGQTVKHVWEKEGVIIFEKPFNITSPRYRTYTSVKNAHLDKGEKIVAKVIDQDGNVLAEEIIKAQ